MDKITIKRDINVNEVIREIGKQTRLSKLEIPRKTIFPYLQALPLERPNSPLYSRIGIVPLHDHTETLGKKSRTFSFNYDYKPPANVPSKRFSKEKTKPKSLTPLANVSETIQASPIQFYKKHRRDHKSLQIYDNVQSSGNYAMKISIKKRFQKNAEAFVQSTYFDY